MRRRQFVHHRSNLKKQLLHHKGLSEVVVGAKFQSSTRSRPSLRAVRTKWAFQCLQAGPFGTPQIHPCQASRRPISRQQIVGAQLPQCIRAIFDFHHGVPLTPQIEGQHLAQGGRVLRESKRTGVGFGCTFDMMDDANDAAQQIGKNTIAEALGLEITEVGDGVVRGKLPVES